MKKVPMKTTNPNCKKHYSYKAILKPRTACEPCWRKWFEKETTRSYQKYAKNLLEKESINEFGKIPLSNL